MLARPVNSFDEWTRLSEVILGDGAGFRYHELDLSFRIFNRVFPSKEVEPIFSDKGGLAQERIDIPPRIVAELQEDLAEFEGALHAAGVIVHRPVALNEPKRVRSPYWEAWETPALNIRDQAIIFGDTIVETGPQVRSRYFENDLLKPVFQKLFDAGSKWICMPRPTLSKGTIDTGYISEAGFDIDDYIQADSASAIPGLNNEFVFDGAQCLRLGRDVLVNVSNANHELGLKWLEQWMGNRFRFHRLFRVADNHIDTIVLPLRPGLLLVRAPQFLDVLPDALRSWDVIFPPEMEADRFPNYDSDQFNIASKYVDMNLLSLDENTVIVNSHYPELIEVLERHRFTVVPVRHRHRRLFAGGFHCFTLDCVRAGGLEDYLT